MMKWPFTLDNQYTEVWKKTYGNVTIFPRRDYYKINENGITNQFTYYNSKQKLKNEQIVKTYNDGSECIIYDGTKWHDIDSKRDIYASVDTFDVDSNDHVYLIRIFIDNKCILTSIDSRGNEVWHYRLPDHNNFTFHKVVAVGDKVFVYLDIDADLFLWIFDNNGNLLEKQLIKSYPRFQSSNITQVRNNVRFLVKKLKDFLAVFIDNTFYLYDYSGILMKSLPVDMCDQVYLPENINENGFSFQTTTYLKRYNWDGEQLWLLNKSLPFIEHNYILNENVIYEIETHKKINMLVDGIKQYERIFDNTMIQTDNYIIFHDGAIGLVLQDIYFRSYLLNYTFEVKFVKFTSEIIPIKEYSLEEEIIYLDSYGDTVYAFTAIPGSSAVKRRKKNIGFMLQ